MAVGVGIVAVLLALFFGYLGHISETEMTFGGRTYEIDMYGVPHLQEEGAEAPMADESPPHEAEE